MENHNTGDKKIKAPKAVAIAFTTGVLALSMAGCGKSVEPPQESEPVIEQTIEVEEEENLPPVEPYVTSSDMQALVNGDLPYLEVANANEARDKGMTQYVIQNPNTTNADLYTIDLPEVEKIQIKPFTIPDDTYWGPDYKNEFDNRAAVTGTVINLGNNDIKNGEINANSPQVEFYVFDEANMSSERFASIISTTPSFAGLEYSATPPSRFDDFWIQSGEGLWTNGTWGNRPDLPGILHRGEAIGDYTAIENDNRPISETQFPGDYGATCYFGGQAFYQSVNDNKSVFVTYTFVNGRLLDQGKIPNLNDPAVRELLLDYATSTSLSTARGNSEGEYALISQNNNLFK
jgi:hypothetical protein